MRRLFHEFPPIYSSSSKVLILGSFPSVKSREISFYYGHKMNRFWKVLAELFKEKLPQNNSERRQMVIDHHLALWDVIESCEIVGSADSTIRNVKVNNIEQLIAEIPVRLIVCNGNTAYQLFQRYIKDVDVKILKLPSTSPANASWHLSDLVEKYKIILSYI